MSQQQHPKWNFLTKLLGVFFVILVPIFLLMVVFMPLISKKEKAKYVGRYEFKEMFSKQDVAEIIGQMRNDKEFVFYFAVLTEANIESALDDVYSRMDRSRERGAYYDEMMGMKSKVQTLALLFNNATFPKEFFKDPQGYPDLCMILWSFIYEEFKLDILGASYKSTYDINFEFQWGDFDKQAAHNLHEILQSLNQDQIKAIADTFSNSSQ